jgi:hypothetical protein
MTGADRRIKERSRPVRHVIVAQAIRNGRAPAELGCWPGRLLNALLASTSVRILLDVVVVTAMPTAADKLTPRSVA